MLPSIQDRLRALAVSRTSLPAGARLFREGDEVRWLHLVDRGEVVLERTLQTGGRLALQRARAGDILAEASVFAARYHCDALVTVDAEVARVAISLLRDEAGAHPDILPAFARHLAHQLQQARHQSEILATRGVAERLDAWLALSGGALPDKGRWNDLAASLAITPEALYRELARRRRRDVRRA